MTDKNYQRLLQVVVVLILLGGAVFSAWGAIRIAISDQSMSVAHHNAPVDYNVTVGNLNQDMVHNGVETNDDVEGANDNGILNWSDPWVAP